jgi:hypothetical protein
MDILRKGHQTPYTIHPGEIKMYRDLRENFRWKRMKFDIVKYVTAFVVRQLVKHSIKGLQFY